MKSIYFASDVHLGLYPIEESRKREKLFVQWLRDIYDDTEELYLLGDILDFWHEYKKVIPRGFTRVFGALADFTDSGKKVHYFTGNHDMWIYDYLPDELGLIVHKAPIIKEFGGKRFFLGHGDGVGAGDTGYKFMKKVFTNRLNQWLFARIHPNGAFAFGHWLSKTTRYGKGIASLPLQTYDKEILIRFALDTLPTTHYDYFIFGHRHLAYDIQLQPNARIINLGDWLTTNTFARFDGVDLKLLAYKNEHADKILMRKL